MIKVTAEELTRLSGNVSSGSQQIQQELGRLQGQVTGIGSSWEGQAAGQFNHLFDEWQRSASGLKDALDGISRLLAHAAVQYEQTEHGIASSFNG